MTSADLVNLVINVSFGIIGTFCVAMGVIFWGRISKLSTKIENFDTKLSNKMENLEARISCTREDYVKKDSLDKFEEKINDFFIRFADDMMEVKQALSELKGSIKTTTRK